MVAKKSEEFYEILQNIDNNINRNGYMIVAEDFNADVGNSPVRPIMRSHVERMENRNERRLIVFA